LVLLTLGWLGGGSGWFFDDQYEFLWSAAGLKPLFAIVGLAFVSLAMAAARSPWHFASGVWLSWGSWVVALPLAISTFDPSVFASVFDITFAAEQVGILIGASVIVGSTLWLATQCRLQHRLFVAALFVIVVALLIPGRAHKPWLAPYLLDWLPFLAYSA